MCRVLHVVLERLADISGNVDYLDFKGGEVFDLASVAVRNKHKVDVAGGFTLLSFSRTSVRDVQLVSLGKKKSAAWSAMSHFSRKLIGHVIAIPLGARTQQVPRGSLALSFVQFGTLLLNGHSFFARCLAASAEKLSNGKPKTSIRG